MSYTPVPVNFDPTKTLIVPMDSTYQNGGMYKAFGLIFRLLYENIIRTDPNPNNNYYDPAYKLIYVYWAINPSKDLATDPLTDVDFTATTVGYTPTNNPTSGVHQYSGGPFIIQSENLAYAKTLINAWNTANTVSSADPTKNTRVAIHELVGLTPVTINTIAKLIRPPRISVEDKNADIPIEYLNAAGLPDYYQIFKFPNPQYTTTPVWTDNNISVLESEEISQGAFFGNTYQTTCKKLAYDIFISPHTGEDVWTKVPNTLKNLDDFIKLGGVLHSMCASIEAIENNAKFLTTGPPPPLPSGITAVNKGDNFFIKKAEATNPLLQVVHTTDPQDLPGGSVQTWQNSLTAYKPLVDVLAYFTEVKNNITTQYDLMVAGQYQGSIFDQNAKGAGAIVYEGGHSYEVKIPYTSNQEDMYTKFVLNSIFLSVTKPLIELTMNPNLVSAGTPTNIEFSIKNIGGAVAKNATISVTLLPDMDPSNYSPAVRTGNLATGYTLTWSNITLDGGQAITFDVDNYTPTSTDAIYFTATYGDEIFATGQNPYVLDACSILAVVPQDTPVLLVQKKVDGNTQTFIESGDSVVFTYNIPNVGDQPADTIVLYDEQLFDHFDSTSFIVTTIPASTPPTIDPILKRIIFNPGLQIASASVLTVTVNATHNGAVPPDTIVNKAYVTYINAFIPGNPITSPYSNPATTNIVLPDILVEKSVDPANAAIGDILKYTIDITNPGNTVITKVDLIDYIPDGTIYVGPINVTTNISPLTSISSQYNSGLERIEVTVIGELDPISTDPDTPKDIITVEFYVIVDSIPENPIKNEATVDYFYKIGDQSTGPAQENSTIADTQIASLQIAKTAPQFVKLGEELLYTISLTNNGIVPLTNVKVVDTIPDGTIYKPGSVTGANFISQAGQVITLEVPPINPTQTVTVTIKVTVNTLPPAPSYTITNLVSAIFTVDGEEKPPITDTETTTVVEGKIDVNKGTVGDISNAKVGDIITYKIDITNTGNVPVTLTTLTDVIQQAANTSFQGDFRIDGVLVAPQPANLTNVLLNKTLQVPPQIPTSTQITYKVKVESLPTGPNPKIDDTVTINFTYQVGQQPPVDGKPPQQDSYTVNIQTPDILVEKKVDPVNAAVGDILTYTVDITNTGTVNIDTVTFTDFIPTGTSYVGPINVTTNINPAPTISENYIPGSPPKVEVIVTGQFKPLNKITITFKVEVVSIIQNPIENKATVLYTYKLNPNENPRTGTETIDKVYTNVASLIITKEAPQFVKLGEILTYTISLENNGQVPLQNVQINDTIPDETTFVNATVSGATKKSQQVNGKDVTIVVDPVNPVPPGSIVYIDIEVSVDKLPLSPYQIKNSATAIYAIDGDPKPPVESEEVTTTVQEGKIDVNKGTLDDITYAKVGDTVTYEVNITNIGNVPVTLTTLTDVIQPSDTAYTDPDTTSITLNKILNPTESTTVTYDVEIIALPPDKKIDNKVTVDFNYKIGTKPQTGKAEDSFTLNVEEIKVSLIKSVKPTTYAEPGDELKYTFTIKNQSSVPITNVYLYDPLPPNTIYADSFSLDPTQNPTISPGAFVGTIPKNSEVIVSFKVKVNSNLTSAVNIPDTGSVTYNYKLNPNEPGPGQPAGPVNSNPVNTKVEIPKIEIIKSVLDAYAEVGDIVTYTLTVKNTGTVNAYDVEVIDILPADELLFVPLTLTVDPSGVWIGGTNPSYIKISTITPNDVVTIQFDAEVISRPQSGKIDNIAHANFMYSLDPNKPPTSSKKNIPSNKVTITVQEINVEILKTTTKSYVEVGQNLTYTVQITNKSTVPVDITFTDELPTEVEYVGGSFNVIENESATVNNKTTDNNLIEVDIKGMPPQSLVIFSYTVKVLSLPPTADPQEITNKAMAIPLYSLVPGQPPDKEGDPVTDEVTTPVKLIRLKVTKSVNESIATIGDILHYTVTIINTGNTIAQNVVFSDNVPNGTKLVEGSLKVDGDVVASTSEESVYVLIGDIAPTQTVIVKFNVEVVDIPAPPNEPIAENTALVTFEVELDGQLQPRPPVVSNPVQTDLVNVKLEVIKSVDKESANVGDTLTYTVVITNTGDIPIDNVIFSDVIPPGTVLVGTQPVQNIPLGTILPGASNSKTVTFKVKIVSKPCPPKLINKATITGSYTVGTPRKLIEESNEVVTYVGVSIFKQLSVDANVKIPPQKPEAEDIIELTAYVDVTYTYLIKTPIVTSYEGQELTGWKLIVEGIIRQKVVYIANEPTQSVHAAEFEIPFSTFVILPKDYKPCSDVRVTGYIEDDFAKLLSDRRTIFKNITLMIEGRTGC